MGVRTPMFLSFLADNTPDLKFVGVTMGTRMAPTQTSNCEGGSTNNQEGGQCRNTPWQPNIGRKNLSRFPDDLPPPAPSLIEINGGRFRYKSHGKSENITENHEKVRILMTNNQVVTGSTNQTSATTYRFLRRP